MTFFEFRMRGWLVRVGFNEMGKGEDMSRKCERVDVGRGRDRTGERREIQKSERDVYALVFILTRIGIPDRELTKESGMLLLSISVRSSYCIKAQGQRKRRRGKHE
jgi:hypothetical protein